ncbi:MAG TPA: MarR family transcriptional regulator [Steroidobacteraceae bacterium]|jgi:DNA-binding transcriptional regulator GbsR (MarR family)|nr:MarR family transcriptional regulator [Steroidobacteraceae bacterium]
MTEITDTPQTPASPLAPAVQQFVLHWGNLGDRWGVNRSVSQIHALLYVADKPLTAEEIADSLGIARSNVSNSLRELLAWDLIRAVPVLRDRRTFYVAETDLWTLVSRIAAGRKERELDPAAAALKECLAAAETDDQVSPVATRRLREMLDFVERTGRWYEQMIRLPRAQITSLMKLGAGVVRLLDRGSSKRAGESAAAR